MVFVLENNWWRRKIMKALSIVFILLLGLLPVKVSAGDFEQSSNDSFNKDMQALQNTMMNDKEIMNLILTLQNNPDMKKILEDPDILNAVNSGDISALTANPRFMELMNNQIIKQIRQKVLDQWNSPRFRTGHSDKEELWPSLTIW